MITMTPAPGTFTNGADGPCDVHVAEALDSLAACSTPSSSKATPAGCRKRTAATAAEGADLASAGRGGLRQAGADQRR